jgi:very-short-patch-repair endonuclease
MPMLKRNRFVLYTDEELKDLLYGLHVTQNKSVLQISKELGLSRATVYKWCAVLGIPTRSGSEANRVSMAQMDPEKRAARVSKAHDAVRGMTRSLEQKLKTAKTTEKRAVMSKWEKWFAKWLIDANITGFKFNYAIGPYNADFAFPERMIVVEIDGGNWHATPRKQEQDEQKEIFLREYGWTVFRINTAGYKNKKNEYTTRYKKQAEELITQLSELLGPSCTRNE